MVLTDDNFASIVAAVEEGRVVYDNIRKFITYIFVHAIPEVVPFVLFAALGRRDPAAADRAPGSGDRPRHRHRARARARSRAGRTRDHGPLAPPARGRDHQPRDAVARLAAPRRCSRRCWSWAASSSCCSPPGGHPGDATGAGTPLHHAYLQATTMTWAGIVACQMGAAFAVRTEPRLAASRSASSPTRICCGASRSRSLFAAAIIYVPPLQSIFHTAALGPRELLVLACFPVIVWGSDELWRWRLRRRGRALSRKPEPALAGAS